MNNKEKEEIIQQYTDYFKEDLNAISEELETSKKYSAIIDKEIDMLSKPGLSTKGSQHYLIEHITNAVQLQTQREGLRKDRVNIKKLIMDYANKQLDKQNSGGDEQSLLEVMNKLLEQGKTEAPKTQEPIENLDDKIDDILDNTKED